MAFIVGDPLIALRMAHLSFISYVIVTYISILRKVQLVSMALGMIQTEVQSYILAQYKKEIRLLICLDCS